MTILTFQLKFRGFVEARKFAHSLNLKSRKEWDEWCAKNMKSSKPKDIPVVPNIAYKDNGWIDYSDWLGINTNK